MNKNDMEMNPLPSYIYVDVYELNVVYTDKAITSIQKVVICIPRAKKQINFCALQKIAKTDTMNI